MTVIKRFIAGAVCPRCGEMDRLVSYSTADGTFKECVACDFSEKQMIQLEQSELDTRVNDVPKVVEENVQVVNFVDLPKK